MIQRQMDNQKAHTHAHAHVEPKVGWFWSIVEYFYDQIRSLYIYLQNSWNGPKSSLTNVSQAVQRYVFANPFKGLMCSYQRAIVLLHQSIQLRKKIFPMIKPAFALLALNLQLVSPKQTVIWQETRNCARIMRMLFISVASTDADRDDSVGEEWIELDEQFTGKCPVHGIQMELVDRVHSGMHLKIPSPVNAFVISM